MSQESSPHSSDSERNSDNNFEKIPSTEDVIMNIDEFDNNLPDTVSLIRCPNGSKIYLVGTVHFSIESQNDVSKVIETVKPDIILVELCASRINILQLDEKTLLEEAKNINMEKIRNTIKQNGLFNGLMYILFLNMSAHLTKQLGMAPGGEFRRAFYEAKKLQCELRLGDRPIEITIQRALKSLSWFQTIKLYWHLITSKDPISKEDVENCKRRDMLEELIAEMAGEYPPLGEVFVRERDIFLTHSLQIAALPIMTGSNNGSDILKYPKVVGVVGIGHVAGIMKLWSEVQAPHIPGIVTIPKQTMCSKIIKQTFKLSLLTLSGYLVYRYVPGAKRVPIYCYSVVNNLITYVKA